VRGGILGLIVLVVLCYLFGFVGRREVLVGTPYTLVVQPGVPKESVQLVTTGLEHADRFLIDTMGQTLADTIEVRIASFQPCSPLEPIPPLAATANVVGRRMCVNTSSGTWQQALRGEPGIMMSVMAHEHYHSMQKQLGCIPSPWRKDYQWLIEGSAAYIGWETAIASGDLDRAWVDALLHNMHDDPSLGSLTSYERSIDGDAAYALGYQAVEQLVDRTGSVRSLNDFCPSVGSGTRWRTAFAQTFGIELNEFYAAFEGSR
jgi:hypothetical protein